MKTRIISFILSAVMLLGIFTLASCKSTDEHDHEHPSGDTTTETVSNGTSESEGASKDFDYYDIAQEVIYDHELSLVMPLVKVSCTELLPDNDFPKIITHKGENIIYSYYLLSETCRKMLNDAKAEIPGSAWLLIDYEKNILHGYFYDPLTEANDPAYDYFSADVPTSSASTREIIFYRVKK